MLASLEVKIFAFFIAVTCVVHPALGEETLMEGGRSPTGKYEVRITQETKDDPHDYGINIYSNAGAKPLFSLDSIGGYLRYSGAIERCRAIWHSTGEFVAITDQGTRHSRELYIVAVYPDHAERLEIPDYAQNAFGRVDATSADFASVASPQDWDGDDLIVKYHFTANHRRSYTCEVVLHLLHGPNSAPSIELKRVSTPTKSEG
jgi:hypothetical protein